MRGSPLGPRGGRPHKRSSTKSRSMASASLSGGGGSPTGKSIAGPLPPPPAAIPEPAPIGTLAWRANNSSRIPQKVCFGNSDAHIMTIQVDANVFDPRAILYAVSSNSEVYATRLASVTDHIWPTFSSVAGAKTGNGFAVGLNGWHPPLVEWKSVSFLTTSSSSTSEWTWTDNTGVYQGHAALVEMADDASLVGCITNDLTPHGCVSRTWNQASSTPIYSVNMSSSGDLFNSNAVWTTDLTRIGYNSNTLFSSLYDNVFGVQHQLIFSPLTSGISAFSQDDTKFYHAGNGSLRVFSWNGTSYSSSLITSFTNWGALRVVVSDDGAYLATIINSASVYSTPMHRLLVVDLSTNNTVVDYLIDADDLNDPVGLHINSDGTKVVLVMDGGQTFERPTSYYWKRAGASWSLQGLYAFATKPFSSAMTADGSQVVVVIKGSTGSVWTTDADILLINAI